MLLVPHYLAEFMWDQRFKDSFTFGLMWPNSSLYELHCKNLDFFFKSTYLSKKSHICKEGGHTSQFLFGIYWWTWKKNCWSGSIKNGRILIFTMLHFLTKIKKNIRRYHYCVPKIFMTWSTDIKIYSVTDWNW